MNNSEILNETKKAIDLWLDKTYTESEFYSHILAIIKDNSEGGHREQIERLLFKLTELQEKQALYWSGHKHLLSDCKKLEKELIIKVQYLVGQGGYSIERFQKQKQLTESTTQKGLFS